MKIVFIIYSYSSGGGAESLLTTIVNNLNKEKYDISIIEVVHSDIKIEDTDPAVHILPFIMSADDPRPRFNMRLLYENPKRVFDYYLGDEFDLYISFNYQLPSFLLPDNHKSIAWIHTCIYDLAQAGMERYLNLQRRPFKVADKIVSISDITSMSICELFPEYSGKVVEIYNGLDINNVREKSKESTSVLLLQPAVIFVGRLEKRKCPDRLYRMIAKLHQRGKKYHVYFIGYGPLRNQIEKDSLREGLTEFVHFLGYIENPFPIIRQARATVLLSTEEGFPMCLLESLALGVPFVSTVVGGARVLAENKFCGTVIETDFEAQEAIVYYVENENRELVENYCYASVERFNLNSYIKRIEHLFDSVLAEN